MASIPLPNGAQIALATTFSTSTTISAITNAKPAVATATGHTYTDGDVIIMSNSWTKTDNGVFRVDGAVAATSFEIEGLGSTDTAKFPTGGGVGSAREITAWTQLPKIPTFEMTGGDAKSFTTSYIDYEKDFEIFTGTNPERLNFTISYQPDSPAYTALVAAGESGTIQVVRLVLKGGSTLYYPGQVFFNKAPVTTKDQEMVNNVSLALQGEITRYAKLP